MTHDPHDQELDQELGRRLTLLADRAPYVAPDPAADVARGRRRVRRRGAAAGVGAAAAVAAATVVVALLPGGADPRGGLGPDPAGRGGSATRAVDGASAAPVTVRELGPGEGLDVVTDADRLSAAAEDYAQVVASRLDPSGEHAVLPAENRQTTGGAGPVTALGTRVGWRVPGEEGEGLVEVTVRRSAGAARVSCLSQGPSCEEVDPPEGATAARVDRRDDSLDVAVLRDDGSLVTLSTATRFANNSLVAVSGVDVTAEQLLDVATDPRLVLPDAGGGPSSFPEAASLDAVLQLGREVLPGPGATFTLTDGGPSADGGYSAVFSGSWSGPGGRGKLTWSPDDDPSVARDATCVEKVFSRCEVRTQDGREAFVGHERDGRGFRVYAIGPLRAMSVSFRGTGYPVDRAVAFVLDPRLQEG